ncbi:SGNH/GDSL hydrolase family protein [Peterkaempfera sp. SMS 1(5)a]|uniref:SGNH/GDSL hydrolase family protein n=1 Tax=Peterkaempfera podocarpi TaxID=3232308 RepID=UPI00366EE3B6
MSRRRVLKLAGAASVALGLTVVAGEYGFREANAEPPRARQSPAAKATPKPPPRIASWAAAPLPPEEGTLSATGLHDAQLRMVVRPTIGGTHPRIRISNRYGTAPLQIAGAWIAPRAQGPDEKPGTRVVVTFGGSRSVVLQPGQDLVSDAVALSSPVAARTALLVSLTVSGSTGPVTWHPRSRDVSYLLDGPTRPTRAAGSAARARQRWTGFTGWYWLSGLDLLSDRAAGTVVCFGDSITDGPSTAAKRTTVRWPDLLAERIAVERPRAPYGVVDLGIAGNRLLQSAPRGGVAALDRFDQDALGQPGATDLILLEGINDIGFGRDTDGLPITAEQLITAQRTLIGRARRSGLRVHGCTLLPFEGAKFFTPVGEQVRQQFNAWVRNGGAFDSVVDFERAVLDPEVPTRIAVPYDSGDHLHPSDAGAAMLAGAVDLTALAALHR